MGKEREREKKVPKISKNRFSFQNNLQRFTNMKALVLVLKKRKEKERSVLQNHTSKIK
jgi:hypothetical protein